MRLRLRLVDGLDAYGPIASVAAAGNWESYARSKMWYPSNNSKL